MLTFFLELIARFEFLEILFAIFGAILISTLLCNMFFGIVNLFVKRNYKQVVNFFAILFGALSIVAFAFEKQVTFRSGLLQETQAENTNLLKDKASSLKSTDDLQCDIENIFYANDSDGLVESATQCVYNRGLEKIYRELIGNKTNIVLSENRSLILDEVLVDYGNLVSNIGKHLAVDEKLIPITQEKVKLEEFIGKLDKERQDIIQRAEDEKLSYLLVGFILVFIGAAGLELSLITQDFVDPHVERVFNIFKALRMRGEKRLGEFGSSIHKKLWQENESQDSHNSNDDPPSG